MERIYKPLLFSVFVGVCALFYSCSSDSNPNQAIDFSKVRLERMDLSHATAIGLINNLSRADGVFKDNGLYKIDENGNISTVAVYMIEEPDGERYQTHIMNMTPLKLINLSDNYFVVTDCSYYDEKGEPGDVPYSDLLVRKDDGKIWCVDNVTRNNSFSFSFENVTGTKVDNHGLLYVCNYYGDIFRMNLDSYSPSFEQLNRGTSFGYPFYFTKAGALWSDYTFIWANAGFQKFNAGEDYGFFDNRIFYVYENSTKLNGVDVYGIYSYDNKHISNCIVDVDGEPYFVSLCGVKKIDECSKDDISKKYVENGYFEVPEKDFVLGKISKLNTGGQPGSVTPVGTQIDGRSSIMVFDSQTYNSDIIWKSSFASNDKFIVCAVWDYDNKTRVSVYDIEKNEWNHAADLNFVFKFGDFGRFTPLKNGTNKIVVPEVKQSQVILHWLNLKTMEHSCEELPVEIASYMENKGIENGYTEFAGVNPSTGNTESIKIDMASGEYSLTVTEPNMIFETLIPLN